MSLSSLLMTGLTQWGLWLIFADSANYREVITGALAAALCTWVAALFLARTSARFKLQWRYLAQAIHVPEILFTGTWILLRVIAMRLVGKEVPGGIVAVHFRAGSNDRRSRGRRALAIAFLTFAPNNLVFGILEDRGILFFHTVIPQPLPSFMLTMGAEPDRTQ